MSHGKLLSEAIERAQSRAGVLQSLNSAYGKKNIGVEKAPIEKAKENKRKSENSFDDSQNSIGLSSKKIVANSICVLQHVIHDRSERTKNILQESIASKSIVLDNSQKQITSAKNQAKNNRYVIVFYLFFYF
jgi:hypothetical protein